MKHLKILETVNKYILYGLLTIFVFALVYFLLVKIGLKEEVITVMTATLIGGALTLFGVKLTLDHHSRQQFIEDTPIKIHHLYHLIDHCSKLKEAIGQNHHDKIPGIIDAMFELASKVNGEVFHEVVRIREKTLIYLNDSSTDRQNEEAMDIKLSTCHFVFEQRERFQQIADRLMKRYLSISKKYHNF